ncbi:MAG: hypothetical protein EOP19_11915, partial [Hyphomicrobiales bacterium]
MTSFKTSTTSKATLAIVVAAISITTFAPAAIGTGGVGGGRKGGDADRRNDDGQSGLRGGRG